MPQKKELQLQWKESGKGKDMVGELYVSLSVKDSCEGRHLTSANQCFITSPILYA